MAKQLNIDLSFNADASKAKAQIMDLQRSLDQLISSTINNNKQLGIDKEIKQAIDDATKLKVALQAATDADTGKLNLAKFSESLKNGQMTLQQYAQHLKALGPEGEQSFLKLSKAIVSAETPMRQTNTLLNQMFVTLKNTAKWQISSSIIHGLQGGLQQAFNYAKDLDTSLNNIRIVTGYSTEEMAKFAGEANKAAQALSTTTTSYTDAALIYYQQGIRDQDEIAARTETTIKLANVSRQTAEDVSSQMTAIWNNFDDGTHNLEYYADVITALGATTASSSQEIAKGMQQFAAVADTVGLSYEYAAASLATIVSVTRQSESTVGNGLRTIFSRLEGLKLGDTLEDGTDLTKYSEALAVIGVNIKDASGQLKDMDTILEETAGKWDQLDKAQKVAFATTVGGVRQYTNLIALLDNWDTVQENINTAKGAEGTLQEQADIYAQSWEAAEKRVRAAAQKIYKDLIDEKFFIKLGDFFTTALNGVDNFINAIGGIPGVIAGVGVVLTAVFGKQLSESINSAMYEFSRFTGKAEDIANIQRQDAIKSISDYYNTGDGSFSLTSALLKQEVYDSYELQKITANLTNQQKAYAQEVLRTAEQYHQVAIESEKVNNNTSKQLANAKGSLANDLGNKKFAYGDTIQSAKLKGSEEVKLLESEIKKLISELAEAEKNSLADTSAYERYVENLEKVKQAKEEILQETQKLEEAENKENVSTEKLEQAKRKLAEADAAAKAAKAEMHGSYQLEQQDIEAIADFILRDNNYKDLNRNKLIALIQATADHTKSLEENIKAIDNAIKNDEEFRKKLEELKTGFQDIGTGAVNTLRGVSQLSMGITSIKGAMDALNDTDLTFFEKFSRVSMGFSIGLSQLAAGLPTLTTGLKAMGTGLMNVIPLASSAGASLTAAFGATAGPIMVAVGAIGLLIGTVLALKAAWENFTPEGKLSVAKKEAEETKKSYEEAKKAVIEFKSQYDDWSSLYEKTKELKVGTEEYTEAMLKANDAAADLIDKYDLIAGQDWEIDENGNYVIKESVNDRRREAQDEAQIKNANAEIKERNTQITKDAKDVAQKGLSIDVEDDVVRQAFSTEQVENMARELSTGKTTIEEITAKAEEAGVVAAKSFADSINELAIDIRNAEAMNKNTARQAEISNARLELGENYKAELEPLLNKFVEKNVGVNGEGSGDHVIKAEEIAKVYNDALGSITSKDIDDSTKQQLAYALAEAQLKGSNVVDLSGIDVTALKDKVGDKLEEVFGDNAQKIQDAINRSSDQIDLEKFTNNFQEIHKVIDKLKDGSVVDSADYNMLLAASEGTSDYFTKMLDGTYKLIGDAKEFYNLVHEQQVDEAKKKIGQLHEENTNLSKIANHKDLSANYDYASEDSMIYQSAWGRTSEGDQITGFKEADDTSGFNFNLIDDQLNLLSQLDQSSEMATKIDSWKEGGYTKEEAEQIAAALKEQFDILSQLDEKQKQNIQTEQELANGILISSNSLDSLNENLNYLNQNSSEGVNFTEGYNSALMSLGLQYDNCTEEVDNFQKALKSNDAQTIQNAHDALLLAVRTGELAKKYNLDTDALESMSKTIKSSGSKIKGLSDNVKDCDEECVEIAKDISRFDKAVVSINKNFDKWQKALKSDNLQDLAESMSEMEDAYSDLLDIDGSALSSDFLQDEKNLNLMKQAIEGNSDAYDTLLQKANENLTAGIRDALSDGALSEFNSALENVDSMLSQLGWDALDAGTSIEEALSNIDDPTFDNTAFLNALSEMVTKAGMTAEEATDYLSSMGIDATVEAPKQKVTETVAYDLTPTITMEEREGQSPATTGEGATPTKYSFPKVKYEQTPIQTEKEVAGVGLQVTSANKSSGGKVKFNNSSNASGSKKSGGGGGGGGGGGSAPKPAKKITLTKKNDDKEADRYIKINQELSQKEHENTMLNAQLQATSGKTAIKTMKQQLGLLKQQKKLYQDLEKEAKAYREQDLAKLKKDFAELQFEIDPTDGMLINYETLLKEQTEIYNKVYKEWADKLEEAEKAYLAEMTRLGEAATEDALKPFQEQIDKIKEDMAQPLQDAEEQLEKFKKDTDKYNDSVEQARKAQEEAVAKANEAYSKELEIIAKGVEIKIKVDDADLQYLEFLLKQIGDTVDGTLDRMANYAESIESNMSKIEKYQDGLEDVLDHAGIDFDDLLDGDLDDLGTFNEEDLAKVEEYRDGLISCGEQLIDLREKILNEVHEAFDKFNSDLDDAVGRIEHLKKFTETYKNIIDIIGKKVIDPTGQTTLMLTKTLYTQSQVNTRALQDQLDFQLSAVKRYEEAIAELEADNRHGEHDDTIKEFKEQLKEAQQAYESTQESWLSSWESTVQAAADIYEAELNQILEDFNKSVAGLMGSLDKLSERYNRIQATQSIYVEDYEKIYQLSKLTRDINNSLDDSTTLASKGKLRDIQKEINELQESGVEVSQYDLDVLRKKYEMAIAYEQWQDAQNAKTVVRMQRDNEGNYGYVYTADQSDVEAAQQNYEDKLHEMQVLNGDYINNLQEQIIQAEQECADALANLRASDYASYEEYQAAVEQIRSDYTDRVQKLSSQLEKALGNNQKLYETDWTEYSKATGYKISADEKYIDRFEETVLSQLTGFKTIQDAQDAFVEATNDASDAAAERWEDWYIRSNTALELSGMSMQNYTQEVDEAINGSGGIVDQTKDAEEAVDDMANEYSEKFNDIVDYAQEFARDFDDVIQDIIDSCNEAIEAIRNLLEMMAELDGSDYDSDNDDVIEGEWDKRKDENGNEYWYVQDKKTKQAVNGENVKISWAGDEHTQGYTTTYNVINGVMQTEGRNALGTGGGGTTFSEEEIKKLHKHAMATGGYTGEWGDSSGKLAVLHEKELVLNSDDTANILSAVDMIRSISNTIDLNALAAGAVFAGRGAAVVSSFGKDTLEQNVHITAEFPSVSDHNEIEEALNSLVERAAQFAGRKKF